MTNEENALLDGLTGDVGAELLLTEWKANGGRFYFEKGSPRTLRPSTEDGQLFLTLCSKLVERGKATIEQVRFFYSMHKVELVIANAHV